MEDRLELKKDREYASIGMENQLLLNSVDVHPKRELIWKLLNKVTKRDVQRLIPICEFTPHIWNCMKRIKAAVDKME
jgi:hypothetical protein